MQLNLEVIIAPTSYTLALEKIVLDHNYYPPYYLINFFFKISFTCAGLALPLLAFMA